MRPTAVQLSAIAAVWGGAVALNRSLRRVRGDSMTPTLDDGDLVLVIPVRHPRRGTIVTMREPTQSTKPQVKRVLGLPGEVLRSVHGHLLVDGGGLLEPYAHGRGIDGALAIPAGQVGVLGDNRAVSTDSRAYGPVPITNLDGRVIARIHPRPSLLRARPTRLSIAATPVTTTPDTVAG